MITEDKRNHWHLTGQWQSLLLIKMQQIRLNLCYLSLFVMQALILLFKIVSQRNLFDKSTIPPS